MKMIKRTDLIFLLLRLAAIVGGFAWISLHPNPAIRGALVPLFVFFSVYSIALYGLIHIRPGKNDAWYRGALVFDLFFVNEVIHHSGGFSSHFYLAFFLLVALHSFYFGLRTGLGTALAANFLFVLTNWKELGSIYWGDLFLNGGMLFVVAGVIGMLASQIQKTKKELEKKLDELTVLSELSRTINTTLKLDDVLFILVNWTVQVMGVKACAIYMLDEKKQALVLKASHGFRSPQGERVVPLEGSLGGDVFKTVEPKGVWDIADPSANFYYRSLTEEEGIRSALCVPLAVKSKVLGTLMVFTGEFRNFSAGETELLETLASQAGSAIEAATLYEEMSALHLSIIKAFVAAIDAKDSYTRGHSEYVLEYVRIIAEEMNLSEEQLEILSTGAVLHDVGKIGVSGQILRKPSGLTEEEYAEIKMHVIIGGEIVSQIPALKDVVPLVYHHHEWWNGGGYPDGLAGENIPWGARIIGVADAFEAMTSNRIYRKALSFETAVEQIEKGSGRQFDPEVVKAFMAAVEKDRFNTKRPVLEQKAVPNWSSLAKDQDAS